MCSIYFLTIGGTVWIKQNVLDKIRFEFVILLSESGELVHVPLYSFCLDMAELVAKELHIRIETRTTGGTDVNDDDINDSTWWSSWWSSAQL